MHRCIIVAHVKTVTQTAFIFPIALFLLAALPRLATLGGFVTWDEPMLLFWTIQFWQAVADGRPEATAVTVHPAVPLMWLGGLGLAVRRLADPAPVDMARALVAGMPGLRADDDTATRAVAALLPDATWPVALFNALGIAVAYVLARRLFGRWVAGAFAALLALEPFMIALARVYHVDALQTTCGTVAVLSAAVYARSGARRHVVFSAVAAALAALAKVAGLYVVPWALLLVASQSGVPWRGGDRRRRMRRWAGDFALWGTIFVMTSLALWPALWADPLGTVDFVRGVTLKFATRAVDTSHFFMGRAVDAPGPLFYPVAWLFRASPWLVLGLVFAPLVWRRGRSRDRWAWLLAAAFALGYAALLTPALKKFDRYLLPAWPAWALAAAIGYRSLVRWRRWSVRRTLVTGGVACVIQMAWLAPFHPYYLAWYSPLVGGLPAAVRVLPVGWGEGLDQVGMFLRRRGRAAEGSPGQPGKPAVAMSAGVPGLAPLTGGPVLPQSEANLPRADVVVHYLADAQIGAPDWFSSTLRARPIFTATIRGVPYAWVYPNVEAERLAETLRADPAPLVATRAGYLSRHVAGAVVLPDWPAPIDVPTTLPPGSHDVWLATYPLSPGPSQAEAEFQLATGAYQVTRVETAGAVLTRYRFGPSIAADARGAGLSPLPIAGARFGELVRLKSAAWTAGPIAPTRALGVRLEWSGLAAGGDVTAFLHFLGADGRSWGQADQPIVAYRDDPVWVEQPGVTMPPEVMADEGRQDVLLYVRPETPPGRYRAWLGVYRAADVARLAVSGVTGAEVDGERILLGDVIVGGTPAGAAARR